MKLIMESWRGYLNEIGDSSLESFPFEFKKKRKKGDTSIVEYVFNSAPKEESETTEGNLYTVTFTKERDKSWDIKFIAGDPLPQSDWYEEESYFTDYNKMTGEGQPLKVMPTVVNIIKDFINRPDLNDGFLKFVFEGVPKAGGSALKKTTRTKLYMRYLKKELPADAQYREGTNYIRFAIPPDIL